MNLILPITIITLNYNSNEQVSHLRGRSKREIFSYFQSTKKEEIVICSHQTYGQGSQTKNTQRSKDIRIAIASQYHKILRSYVDKKSYVGCH